MYGAPFAFFEKNETVPQKNICRVGKNVKSPTKKYICRAENNKNGQQPNKIFWRYKNINHARYHI